ncbi:MAG: HD domain-containing protein [Treponema sp.]|nr:HD domain-containing protein [Candidatus Treponema merdequi]
MDLRFLYMAAVFLSLIELIIFYETSSRRTNKNFLILFTSTLVSNFGYTFSVFAPNLESTMFGTMVSYMGSILTITFMLIVIIDLCEKKFNPLIKISILSISLFFIVAVCSTQTTGVFFRNMSIRKYMGLTILDFEPGPLLLYYIIFLALINISAALVIIFSFKSKKQISKKTLFILLGMIIFGTTAYIVPLLLNIKLNLMVFIYILMELIFIVLSVHANMYDISSNLMEVYKLRGGYGYIAFDIKKRFLGCDELAIQLLPDLKEIPIDSKINSKYTDIITKLNYNETSWKWIDNLENDFTIEANLISAICTIHPLKTRKKILGYLFELRDNTSEQNYINGINLYNQALTTAIEEKTAKITAMQDSIIKGMAMMVESRDNSTGGHILRTSDCVRIFVNKLKTNPRFSAWCNQEFCERMIKAAPMHDLGKIAVDDSILRKPGKFEPQEYEQMKKHSTKGSIIVQEVLRETTDLEFKAIAANIAHYHHEKWDGTGYPVGKKGKEIPVEARIMALADVFDALVSRRCYKEAKSFEEAFNIIQNDLGKHFDPEIGVIFLECRTQLEEYYNNALKTDTLFEKIDSIHY